MADQDIDVETLRRLLAFDPETGDLAWLPRPEGMFPDKRSFGIWNTRYAGKPAFTSVDSRGYRCGRVFDRPYRAHRIAWALATGVWPSGTIDHINGDKTDNRPANLRNVPLNENAKNRPMQSNNTSGIAGVSWNKRHRKWEANIRISGRRLHLGRFDDIQAAAEARRAADRKYGFHENHGRTGGPTI